MPTRCDTTKKSLFLNLLLSYVYGEAGLIIVLKEGTGIILLERKGLCGLHQCLDSWQMSKKAWTQCFPADHYRWWCLSWLLFSSKGNWCTLTWPSMWYKRKTWWSCVHCRCFLAMHWGFITMFAPLSHKWALSGRDHHEHHFHFCGFLSLVLVSTNQFIV